MFNRVVVGVDGSRASLEASKVAFRVGTFFDIPVVGVYVVDTRLLEESFLADLAGVLGFTYYEGISSKVKEFLEKQGEAVLDEFSALGREFGAKTSVVQTSGVPYREIASQADPDDLVVVGKVGRRPVRGVLLGSNSDKLTRISKSPVFLVPERCPEFRRALVAYDGRTNSKRALRMAAALRGLFGYELHVITVGEEVGPELREEVRFTVGDDYTHHVTTGFPEEKIVSFCRENGVDLLFIGAYGKGRLKEFFLGSVTSFVVHNLDIPMVLTRSPEG
jgi:nucleotide-binding universal stress UspA family protein